MKVFSNKPEFLDSDRFKNYVIAFGMCLSVFTITSFDSVTKDKRAEVKKEGIELSSASCQNTDTKSKTDIVDKQSKHKTHHNFIASYLLEESSAKKEEKDSGTETKFLGRLLQLHKTIISNAFSQL